MADSLRHLGASLEGYLGAVQDGENPAVLEPLKELQSSEGTSDLARALASLSEGLDSLARGKVASTRSVDSSASVASSSLVDIEGMLGMAQGVFRVVPIKAEEATSELLVRFEEVQSQSAHAAEAARRILERLGGDQGSGESVRVVADSARESVELERAAIDHVVANNKANASKLREMGDELESGIVIVNEIDEINERSRIIAFNMAVEAARLGEGGRGIRVIVNELRSLNERTSKFAREVVGLLKRFRDYNRALVDEITKNSEKLNDEALAGMEATKEVMESLISNASMTEDLSGQIASSSVEVQRNLDRVLEALQFQDISRQIAEGGLGILQRVRDLAAETGALCGGTGDDSEARKRLEAYKKEFISKAKTKDEKTALSEALT